MVLVFIELGEWVILGLIVLGDGLDFVLWVFIEVLSLDFIVFGGGFRLCSLFFMIEIVFREDM